MVIRKLVESDNIQAHRVGDDRFGFKIGPTADSVCIRWLCPFSRNLVAFNLNNSRSGNSAFSFEARRLVALILQYEISSGAEENRC